jgi:hypothetical protein
MRPGEVDGHFTGSFDVNVKLVMETKLCQFLA